MSRRNKLQKFAELLVFDNVYENYDSKNPGIKDLDGKDIILKSNWKEVHFQNDHPIILELACGRGEYALALGKSFPDKNIVGVDVKGARIWKGAKLALTEKLNNVAFLRCRIEQIAHFFGNEEVDEIWITFPDPFLGNRSTNRRLTSENFLEIYRQILKPGAIVHLKTDDSVLYEFTLDTLRKNKHYKLEYAEDDIYSKPLAIPELQFKTYYEKKHLKDGKTIKYVRFELLKPI